ncbi:MAG: glycosyltransferase [Aestuariibacter sp.]|nr:glycosyltransferase [Marisediminitalea aggregata]MBL52367.1 glycosyltransferase [Alteromonadaceae bacterium]MCP3866342.1 glycosyltransferase [Aestuariibacter sp.]MCP4234785.1 glycosyltransferase [Aestuariibacter sp.]MCP4524486.1 glycosyltransferase [Aestuariibacter sp.]MCP4948558.1 glycosyltransferase [Aestuariibacter sp.]
MHITYDMRIGGTEMVVKNLIEGFDDPAFKMSIFCIEAPLGPWGQDLANAGITITTVARQPGFDRGLIKAIRQHLREHNIDIIHCHQYTPWVYGVLAAAGLKTKVIFTEHGRFYPDFGTWKRKLINPVLAWLTDATTAISSATKQALVTHENLSARNIEVIYNGIKAVDPVPNETQQALKAELGITASQTVFGTIARFDPIKNHLMMLRAFKDVLDAGTDAKLVIVGDGEMRADIETLIKELAISDHVVLTGYQPQPAQYLSIMDIFLLSSFSEGTSMTLLEAMSLGKPCVVTDAGGNAEVIADQQNGLVTGNDKQREFADAMLTLVNDTDTYHQYQRASLTRFNALFTVEAMCQSFRKMYTTVMQ